MRTIFTVSFILFSIAFCDPAIAQASIASTQPPVFVPDNNQVDLRSATVARHAFELNIGDINDPDISLVEGRTSPTSKLGTSMGGNVTVMRCTINNSQLCNNWIKVTYGSYSRWFNKPLATSNPFTNDDGEVFQPGSPISTLTMKDGTVVRFDSTKVTNPSVGTTSEYVTALFADSTKPDGRKIEALYEANSQSWSPWAIKTNTSYALVYKVLSDGTHWKTLINTAVTRCVSSADCNLSTVAWPQSTASGIFPDSSGYVKNALGKRYDLATTLVNSTDVKYRVTDPTGRYYEYNKRIYNSNSGYIGISYFTRGGLTTSYSYTFAPPAGWGNPVVSGATALYPDGKSYSYRTSSNGYKLYLVKRGSSPETSVAFLGDSTPYGGTDGGLEFSTVYPEGNSVNNGYGARRNLSSVTYNAKTGSGLPAYTSSASYPLACSNGKTCNKPEFILDQRGNRTDYTYDPVHGGILTELKPADNLGRRAKVSYIYQQISARYLDQNNQLVSSSPVWKLVSTSTCSQQEICQGTSDETVNVFGYDDNLRLVSETQSSGDGLLTKTIAKTYDPVGNVIAVDGPLPGPADTTRYSFDAARQLLTEVRPDPDGTGPLLNLAARRAYDDAGSLVKVEYGTVNSPSDSGFVSFIVLQTNDITYDQMSRKASDSLSGGGAINTLTQYSYDSGGRLECTAQRMNPAIYASLATSACTLGTAGSFGPDRITRNVYDAAGQLFKVQKAVGVVGLEEDTPPIPIAQMASSSA